MRADPSNSQDLESFHTKGEAKYGLPMPDILFPGKSCDYSQCKQFLSGQLAYEFTREAEGGSL